MKKIINFKKGISNSPWSKLKNTEYTPSQGENSIALQDGELEIKYTKEKNKIIKEISHRHIDDVRLELTCPQSQIDEKAFNYFIKQDISKNAEHTASILSKQKHIFSKYASTQQTRSFATIKYNEYKFEKKLFTGPNITISTSAGDKIVSGLSMHKEKVQIHTFKDHEEPIDLKVMGVSNEFDDESI